MSVLFSMPNNKAAGVSAIPYELLKKLGPLASSFLYQLICRCLTIADIPDLWRLALVYPIFKPYDWNCQLKNTHPITLFETALVKLMYNRLSSVLVQHSVL